MNRKLFLIIRAFACCLCAFSGIQTLRAQATNAPVLSLAPGASPALTVTGIPGASYQVQFTSQLAASNKWTALTNILLGNSAYLFHDPATASNAARFYRALLLSMPSNIFNGYAPSQMVSSEIYQFVASDLGMTSTQTLFISSATNGIWMAPNSLPIGGVLAVGLNFTRLSDLTVQLDVAFPATVSNPSPTTNSYLLAFAGTNVGVFAGPLGAPEPSVGNFSRMTNLVGVNVTSQLAAGEIWSLSASNSSGQNSTGTLVMDSATNGWWIAPGAVGGSLSAATAQFAPQNPLGGTLVVIVPSSFPVTNTFSVEFTTTNSGLFYGALPGFGSAVIGTFTHNTDLVGRTIAPTQLTEGEIYQLSISNAPTPTPGTVAMESPTAGWIAFPTSQPAGAFLPPPRVVLPSTVQFSPLGQLSGNLTVAGFFNPPSTNLITNTWTLVFTTTNSGFMENMVGLATAGFLGTFVRNTAFIGQTLAPQQLTTGDTYKLTTLSEQSTPPSQSFTVNSPTDGLWSTGQNFGTPALTTLDASLQYNRIGPLTGTLTAVYPTIPAPETNTYTLLFTGTNIGVFEGQDSPGSLIQAAGNFSWDTTLENKSLTAAQLNAGEIFQLITTNLPPVSTQTLVLNSSTNGLLVIPDSEVNSGIYPVSLQYTPQGAFGANLTMMVPAIGGNSPVTNMYLLDFNSTAGGVFQMLGSPSAATGGFLLSTALVSQNFAPQQLVNGESYQFSFTNQSMSTPETLILTSATSGLWTVNSGPYGGIFSASVQYSLLGPLAATVNVILPPGSGNPSGSTNDFILIFNSPTNGIFQNGNSAGSPLPTGTFIHSTP